MMWVMGIEPRSSEDQQVLLTGEPFLQPQFAYTFTAASELGTKCFSWWSND